MQCWSVFFPFPVLGNEPREDRSCFSTSLTFLRNSLAPYSTSCSLSFSKILSVFFSLSVSFSLSAHVPFSLCLSHTQSKQLQWRLCSSFWGLCSRDSCYYDSPSKKRNILLFLRFLDKLCIFEDIEVKDRSQPRNLVKRSVCCGLRFQRVSPWASWQVSERQVWYCNGSWQLTSRNKTMIRKS